MTQSCATPTDSAPAPTKAAIRPSRVGKWRALVLLLVHVAIALHIVHWKLNGTTLSPLEPSESMEFSKHGIINAGAIFFASAILLTALFGRFFCGWACHLVALQDACRWLLEKLGLRPRAVNLGVLGLVPWIAFVYMFLAPLAFRFANGHDVSRVESQLSTNMFWQTFPGWSMALATFAVTGGVMIYFLGAKGFCTYGCPYGAIFGVADQLATTRIRVTDACEGCGHCTAVCTSNVRVHQEVRDFKAVVDPGCMKCLDCVSVCPKDALYVGFGAPALFSSARRAPKAPGIAWSQRLARVALAALFMWSCLALLLFHGEEARLELGFAAQLAAGALLVALVFAGKSQRIGGPSLAEDALLGASFLVALYAFRGYRLFPWVDATTPLLLAIGMAVLAAFALLAVLRALRKLDFSVQSLELRRAGRLTAAGWIMACLFVLGTTLTAHAGWSQFTSDRAGAIARDAEHEAARQRDAEARAAFDRGVAHARAQRFTEAIAEFERALELAPEFVAALENLAGMYCAAGRFTEGVALYERALRKNPSDWDTHYRAARALAELGQDQPAMEHLLEAVRLNSAHGPSHELLALLYADHGDQQRAQAHADAARRSAPQRP